MTMLATFPSTLPEPQPAALRSPDDRPAVIPLSMASSDEVLAVGGEVTSACCRVHGDEALLEIARGDLGDAGVLRGFVYELERWNAETAGRARVVAHDLHPSYLSSQYARRMLRGVGRESTRLLGVQHHHAHVLATMAEHGVDEPVIGIACDGTGYGSDGTVWGCEILHVHRHGFDRVAHLRYFPLLGGDAAAREPWRPALALVHQAFGEDLPDAILERLAAMPHRRFAQAMSLLRRGAALPTTSSLGRLFDAAAFLTGLAHVNDEPGSAPRALEDAATDAATGAEGPSYEFRLAMTGDGIEMDVTGMIRQIVHDVGSGEAPSWVARRFHLTVARMLAAAAGDALRHRKVATVALGGGCFNNRLLREDLRRALLEDGVRHVLAPKRVPCGDAGLSLGQAYAAARWRRMS